jgi:hypothetical protein
MRFVTKTAVATLLVDVAVFIYVVHIALGRLPIIESVRGIAALGLVLGLASRVIGGPVRVRHEWAATLGRIASLALGVGALATQHDSFLALFMASFIGLWITGAYVRTTDSTTDRSRTSEQPHPQPLEVSRRQRLPDGHRVTTPRI